MWKVLPETQKSICTAHHGGLVSEPYSVIARIIRKALVGENIT